jgi:hypothetical protein
MDRQCRQAILEKDRSSNISTRNIQGFSSSPENNEINYIEQGFLTEYIEQGYTTKEGLKEAVQNLFYRQPQLIYTTSVLVYMTSGSSKLNCSASSINVQREYIYSSYPSILIQIAGITREIAIDLSQKVNIAEA